MDDARNQVGPGALATPCGSGYALRRCRINAAPAMPTMAARSRESPTFTKLPTSGLDAANARAAVRAGKAGVVVGDGLTWTGISLDAGRAMALSEVPLLETGGVTAGAVTERIGRAATATLGLAAARGRDGRPTHPPLAGSSPTGHATVKLVVAVTFVGGTAGCDVVGVTIGLMGSECPGTHPPGPGSDPPAHVVCAGVALSRPAKASPARPVTAMAMHSRAAILPGESGVANRVSRTGMDAYQNRTELAMDHP